MTTLIEKMIELKNKVTQNNNMLKTTLNNKGLDVTQVNTTTQINTKIQDELVRPEGDALEEQVVKGKTFINQDGIVRIGTMESVTPVTETLDADVVYTIPAGYHDGTGTITGSSLVDQTAADITADMIPEGKTAYANGAKITGTMKIDPNDVKAGATIAGVQGTAGSGGDIWTECTRSEVDIEEESIIIKLNSSFGYYKSFKDDNGNIILKYSPDNNVYYDFKVPNTLNSTLYPVQIISKETMDQAEKYKGENKYAFSLFKDYSFIGVNICIKGTLFIAFNFVRFRNSSSPLIDFDSSGIVFSTTDGINYTICNDKNCKLDGQPSGIYFGASNYMNKYINIDDVGDKAKTFAYKKFGNKYIITLPTQGVVSTEDGFNYTKMLDINQAGMKILNNILLISPNQYSNDQYNYYSTDGVIFNKSKYQYSQALFNDMSIFNGKYYLKMSGTNGEHYLSDDLETWTKIDYSSITEINGSTLTFIGLAMDTNYICKFVMPNYGVIIKYTNDGIVFNDININLHTDDIGITVKGLAYTSVYNIQSQPNMFFLSNSKLKHKYYTVDGVNYYPSENIITALKNNGNVEVLDKYYNEFINSLSYRENSVFKIKDTWFKLVQINVYADNSITKKKLGIYSSPDGYTYSKSKLVFIDSDDNIISSNSTYYYHIEVLPIGEKNGRFYISISYYDSNVMGSSPSKVRYFYTNI